MLTELLPNLYVGDLFSCSKSMEIEEGVDPEKDGLLALPHATVHACKDPCHRYAVKYTGSLAPDHADYLFKEDEHDLYLNMIDTELPLFKPELFWKTTEFITDKIKTMPVIIHCNMGWSRSPSLILIYAASTGIIPAERESYLSCILWLQGKYKELHMSTGISRFMREHWKELLHGRNV